MTVTILPYPTKLTDGIVSLRAHRPADADALAEAVRESIDTVGRWQDWCHAGYTTADATSWLDICRRDWLLGDGFEMLIVDALTDRLLGGMGVNQRNKEQRIANLGYWVRQSEQRRGVATRAARLAIRFAFETVCVERLEIVVAEANEPSRRTAVRIGGVFEGMLRKRLIVGGTSVDAAMHSIVRDDAPARR
ncbi:Protein N-acetyltransferase, RimJ/RimL family [Luteibacter sp. UNCMF331Sha3.1]|uniref:GNAT family N-acetyltransferase n=1 Tax=Luteibacter sp. UNCMF331Sha3.1 TaxID=1502760 RepID=UPI0008CC3961|nr:GNAT family protein [Luteibacter sp. UNCMF331Sha3.1]SEN15351.1 Protein N-acetyltransferase, RimJ/RimL family [Luteibacter sp. UNCMF331Sha3.1]